MSKITCIFYFNALTMDVFRLGISLHRIIQHVMASSELLAIIAKVSKKNIDDGCIQIGISISLHRIIQHVMASSELLAIIAKVSKKNIDPFDRY